MKSQLEIERKWLVEELDPQFDHIEFNDLMTIWVTYIEGTDVDYTYRLTKQIGRNWKSTRLTRKSSTAAMSRQEFDVELPPWAYNLLLWQLAQGRIDIKKTRYEWTHEGNRMELDIFSKPSDLMLLEVELEAEDTEVNLPTHLLKINSEVTGNKLFYGDQIARR